MKNQMRECNGCTKCCEWLVADVYGHRLQPGRPCPFKGETGCTIYNERDKICRTYKCDWLQNTDIPEWMKPNLSNVIVTRREWSQGYYLEILETGKDIDPKVLNWFFMYHTMTNIPMRIQVCRGWNNYGSLEFREEIVKKVNIPSL